MKKILLSVITCAMAMALFAGCGAGDVGRPGYVNSSQAASSQAAAESSASQENADPSKYDGNIDGLCKYFEDKGYVNKDSKKDMYAEVIGAKAGYKYEATVGKTTYVIELYEFETQALNAQAESTVSAVKTDGHYTMVGNQVNATMSDNGKYMISYGDVSQDQENVDRKDAIMKAFNEFH